MNETERNTPMKKLCVLLVLLSLLILPALAEEAEDMTARCVFTVSQGKKDLPSLTDGSYYTQWSCSSRNYVQIEAPEGQRLYGLYVSWAQYLMPWEVQACSAETGEWQAVYTSEDEFFNQYIPLEAGYDAVRLVNSSTDNRHPLSVSEVRVLGEGSVPSWVQQWKNFEGKADLVLLVTDPGDEFLFFGGLIPTYVAKGRQVMLCVVVNTNSVYKNQMLDGLWHCGLTNYPYIAYFKPKMAATLKDQYAAWSETQFVRHVSRIVRMYKPDVLVTHSLGGEGVDGGHKACADASVKSLQTAMDDKYDIGYGYKLWGNYRVKKLYLHLHGEQPTVLDYDQPLDLFGGKTARQMAEEAFAMQDYQKKTQKNKVMGEGVCDGSAYGLYYSQVGEDTGAGDLFEHID